MQTHKDALEDLNKCTVAIQEFKEDATVFP